MRYISKEDFICTYHKNIIEDARKMLKLLDDDDDIMEDLLNGIILSAKLALRAGKRMELRLIEYRSSIEKLGYERKKKKKRKQKSS